MGRDNVSLKTDLGSGKQKYFFKQGWTANSACAQLICPSGKSEDLCGATSKAA
jgi:hypothetical protein